MNRKILFVDDEENVLRGIERTLRSQFDLETAVGAQQGLAKVAGGGPYAVVVSDLRMPGMDGVQFLSEVRQRSPDTVRLILSGNGDFESVVASVNEGSIFQFLTKPCPSDTLHRALRNALDQHQLIVAERELLEETLHGAVGMMTEVLSVVNPVAFGRASRIRAYVRHMAGQLRVPNLWEFELAAMLSQVGCIAVPPEILEKVDAHAPLSAEERETFTSHPAIGHGLLSKIPRLGVVAEIVRRQMTPYRELRDLEVSDAVVVGAQMLLTALFFDGIVARGGSPESALDSMRARPETYQPRIVVAIETAQASTLEFAVRAVSVREMRPGMIVREDIRTRNGMLILAKDQVISEPFLARLRNFGGAAGLAEPLLVLAPVVASPAANPVHGGPGSGDPVPGDPAGRDAVHARPVVHR